MHLNGQVVVRRSPPPPPFMDRMERGCWEFLSLTSFTHVWADRRVALRSPSGWRVRSHACCAIYSTTLSLSLSCSHALLNTHSLSSLSLFLSLSLYLSISHTHTLSQESTARLPSPCVSLCMVGWSHKSLPIYEIQIPPGWITTRRIRALWRRGRTHDLFIFFLSACLTTSMMDWPSFFFSPAVVFFCFVFCTVVQRCKRELHLVTSPPFSVFHLYLCVHFAPIVKGLLLELILPSSSIRALDPHTSCSSVSPVPPSLPSPNSGIKHAPSR